MPKIEDIVEQLKGTDSTKIFFTDLNGRLMSLPVNGNDIPEIIERGVGFDGSSVAGYATVENSDRLLFPLPESFRIVTFADERMGFFIGRIHNEKGERAKADPRAVLEKVLDQAESEYGYRFLVGPEHEFFLLTGDEFERKGHTDTAGYFLSSPQDKGEPVRKRIIDILDGCGIRFIKAHHEVTPSQHEINLDPADPLTASDRTVLFNYVTKKAAREFGLHATFMPKPFSGYNRSAYHIHLSMADRKGKNAFFDQNAENGLSREALRFIGGIIKYGRETSIVMASNFNSYKAYVLEREAPILRGWGFRNRTSMVRVPYAVTPENTRIELRNPDPAGNVYLQMATLIGMGLQGLREGLDQTRPDTGSTYARKISNRIWDRRFLPRSIVEALMEAEKSKFLKDLLGERIYRNYMDLKTADWEDHRVHITDRELEQYLDI
jgi:glutamine synthetase